MGRGRTQKACLSITSWPKRHILPIDWSGHSTARTPIGIRARARTFCLWADWTPAQWCACRDFSRRFDKSLCVPSPFYNAIVLLAFHTTVDLISPTWTSFSSLPMLTFSTSSGQLCCPPRPLLPAMLQPLSRVCGRVRL